MVPSTWRAQRATARLSAATVDRAAALARETGATPYMVLMAAFGALVHRYTHSTDFLVAAPVLNRGAGTEDAIGYYGNTVVMRHAAAAAADVPRAACRRLATARWAPSRIRASTWTGWSASPTRTAGTAPSG